MSESSPLSASLPPSNNNQFTFEQGGFAFVLNVRDLSGASEYGFPEGHALRRADFDETTKIKETFRHLFGDQPFYQHHWENSVDAIKGLSRSLEPEQFRYFILSFPGINSEISDFQDAFDISPKEVEFGPTVLKSGFGHQESRLIHALQDLRFASERLLSLSSSDVSDTIALYRQIKTLPASSHIKRAIRELGALKSLPSSSTLRVLGCFAVLESMLTHQPNKSDPYDSITRQIKSKVALLQNRWSPRLNYAPFGSAKPDKIWSTMYAYRSRIAHGSPISFESSDLSPLGDHTTANALVWETAKAVLRHALAEPQLIEDLRSC